MFGIDDAIALPIIADVGMNLLSSSQADDRQANSQNFSSAQQASQQTFNAQQADAQRRWEEVMSNTSIQRRVQDLQAANINPLLAWQGGGASTPTGAAATSGIASAGIASPVPGHSIAASYASAASAQANEAIKDKYAADAEDARASARLKDSQLPLAAVSIEQTQQNIRESTARITKILQESETSAATAQNLNQQTQNLQAALPQIRATIENLRSLSVKNYAEAKAAGASAGVSEATYGEIQQRVKANLPDLDARLKQLEAKAQNLSMPRRGMEAAANDSFIGALGAVLRTLNPLSGLIGATR